MTVRRVVLAITTGDRPARVAREAVRVASRFGAELEGRFVEDEDLLKLAAHPFARCIGSAGLARELSVDDVEREWRALAGEVRAALEAEAARQRLAVPRFEIRRGRRAEALGNHLDQGDVVVVGWGGWSPRASRKAPIRVLFDGSEASERALEAGVRLTDGGGLAVWMVGADDAAVAAMRARLSDRVGRLRVAPMAEPSIPAIQHILAERPGGLLILPVGSPIARALESGAQEARFPAGVLVVH